MTTIKLYTGGGVSLSPISGEGRTESEYVRLVADDGKGITDGNIITTCVDTKTPEAWTDCDAPDYDDTPEEQPDRTAEEQALTRYANELTGQNDPDLLSAAETIITKLYKEES